jgi:hypothetical protein
LTLEIPTVSANGDPLTISREELYELVWSKPLTELAQDFGLSDVALAKRCRKLFVPIPGRGYWARVAAGQKAIQPKLRKRTQQPTDYSALTFTRPTEPTPAENRPPASPEEVTLREKIAALDTPEIDLKVASAAVRRTAAGLRRPWRNEIAWERGDRSGPIIGIRTSDLSADRALRIAEAILVGAKAVGWHFKKPPGPDAADEWRRRFPSSPPPPPPTCGVLEVLGESLSFQIDERNRQVDHVTTEEEMASARRGDLHPRPPRFDFIPSSELRVHLLRSNSRHVQRTWKDSQRKRLESQINLILVGFLDEALEIKRKREETRLAEIETRRQDQLRWQQSQRRARNAKLIHELESQAGAWLRGRLLRSYLRALRRTTGGKFDVVLEGSTLDFLSWAQHYVDQLDPLASEPHDLDLMDEGLKKFGQDDEIRKSLSRLLGRHWQECLKPGGLHRTTHTTTEGDSQ